MCCVLYTSVPTSFLLALLESKAKRLVAHARRRLSEFSVGVVMTTGCCNGQPLLLQQAQSSFSSSCCNGCHGHGMQGLDHHTVEHRATETYKQPAKIVGQLEAGLGQEWRLRRQQRRRRLRRICKLVCLFVLNVAVSVGVILLLLSFGSFPASKTIEDQRTICVPCSPGESKANEARRLVGVSKDESRKYLCCASDDGERMKELILEGVKLSLQERLKGEDLHSLLNNPLLPPPINRNAAHVFLKLARRRTTMDDDFAAEHEVLRDWSSEGNAAFIRQGIEFNSTSGHFKVKDTGIYVIYSRIVYEMGPSFEDGDEEDYEEWPKEDSKRTLGHTISVYSHNRYKDLLEDEQLSHCVQAGVVCYNSKIFSTLYLTKDALVAVRVRQLNLVSPRSHSSYFGLYKID